MFMNFNFLNMKKFLFMLVTLFSATLFSCGSAEKNIGTTDSIDSVEVTIDTIAIDTIV